MHLKHSISVIGGGARVILVQLRLNRFAAVIRARTSPFLADELMEGFRDCCSLNVLLKRLRFRQILSFVTIIDTSTASNITIVISCTRRFFNFSFRFCLRFASFLCLHWLGRCHHVIERSCCSSGWCQLCFLLTVTIWSIFVRFSDSLWLWRSLRRHFLGLWIFTFICLSFNILAYSFQSGSIWRNCRLRPSFTSLGWSGSCGDDSRSLGLYGTTFSTSLWGAAIITKCRFLNLLVLSCLLHILIKTYFYR